MHNTSNLIMMVLPEDALYAYLGLLMVVGGLLIVVGRKHSGFGLVITAISTPFLLFFFELLLADVFALLPPFAVPIVAWTVIGTSYIFMFGAIFGTTMRFLVGKEAWDGALSILIADMLRWAFRLTFFLLVLFGSIGLLISFWHAS